MTGGPRRGNSRLRIRCKTGFEGGNAGLKRCNALFGPRKRPGLGVKLFPIDRGKLGHAITQLLLDLAPQIAGGLAAGLQQPAQATADFPEQIPV